MVLLEELWHGNVNPRKTMNEMHSLAEDETFSYGFRPVVRLLIESGVPLTKKLHNEQRRVFARR